VIKGRHTDKAQSPWAKNAVKRKRQVYPQKKIKVRNREISGRGVEKKKHN